MSKMCKIECCNNCPNMDNEYYGYSRECMLLGKVLHDKICSIYTEIYKDCPLKDWSEDD